MLLDGAIVMHIKNDRKTTEEYADVAWTENIMHVLPSFVTHNKEKNQLS